MANRFVGDAEPYGYNILPFCLSILRLLLCKIHLLCQRRPTKQLPIAWAPLAKELPVGLRIGKVRIK